MRSLTKTGIRILSAKYRSILIKCAIINASVFIGAFGAGSAFAADVTGWDGFKNAINGTDTAINVKNDINFGADTLNPITRDLSIVGDTTGRYLSGNDTYGGLQIGTDADKDDTLILQDISMQHFKKLDDGAAINNKAIIAGITGNFSHNSANTGGAIYNYGATAEISNITGDFEFNSATKQGGAINNAGSIYAEISNITGNFKGNHTDSTDVGGGAIYNGGVINNITGDFENNYTASTKNQYDMILGGGAIANTKTINISTSDEKSTILFEGNYITNSTGKGGAIWNRQGTVGLYAKGVNDTITFVGGEDDTTNNRYNIDGIYNQATLNINGNGTNTYAGTVNLYNVSDADTPTGTTNIYGGTVNVAKDITQKTITIGSGAQLNATGNIITETLVNNGDITVPEIVANIQNNEGASITFNNNEILIVNLTNSGTVNFNGYLNYPDSNVSITQNAGTINFSDMAATEGNPIKVFTMNGGSVNIADEDAYNILHINQLNLTGNIDFTIDADLENEISDRIKIHDIDNSEIASDKTITIKGINLLSDATQDKINISLFADDATRDVLKNNVRSNIKGLTYSSIYKYDASYDSETGMIGFTRYESGTSDDFNPYIYAPSGVANTTAAMTTQIAALAMDKMDDVVHVQGRSGGDTTKSSNAWVKVMGLNDNVEFNNFENIDSKAMTVTAGYNTNKITWADNSVVFGAYAGYIGGKQHYTANDIDQDGGYVGLSSALTLGDAFLTATVNGGLLKNKANNMYGSDRFNTLWLGTGLKAGYNYAITDSVVLQPNVYGGYTLVNTKDYTSVSGVKIATNNLNFFEIDPGLKLSAAIADGWTGSVQGKYAIVMDNGADITANDFALQNISTKNYIEYGIGIDKSVTDAFYLGAKVNRHDGGRTGWNGSIEFRYKF